MTTSQTRSEDHSIRAGLRQGRSGEIAVSFGSGHSGGMASLDPCQSPMDDGLPIAAPDVLRKNSLSAGSETKSESESGLPFNLASFVPTLIPQATALLSSLIQNQSNSASEALSTAAGRRSGSRRSMSGVSSTLDVQQIQQLQQLQSLLTSAGLATTNHANNSVPSTTSSASTPPQRNRSGSTGSAPQPMPPAPTTERRVRVRVACLPCYKTKAACDATRPCGRCVRLNRADQCQDREHKKMGRRRKAPSPALGDTADIEMDNDTPITPAFATQPPSNAQLNKPAPLKSASTPRENAALSSTKRDANRVPRGAGAAAASGVVTTEPPSPTSKRARRNEASTEAAKRARARHPPRKPSQGRASREVFPEHEQLSQVPLAGSAELTLTSCDPDCNACSVTSVAWDHAASPSTASLAATQSLAGYAPLVSNVDLSASISQCAGGDCLACDSVLDVNRCAPATCDGHAHETNSAKSAVCDSLTPGPAIASDCNSNHLLPQLHPLSLMMRGAPDVSELCDGLSSVSNALNPSLIENMRCQLQPSHILSLVASSLSVCPSEVSQWICKSYTYAQFIQLRIALSAWTTGAPLESECLSLLRSFNLPSAPDAGSVTSIPMSPVRGCIPETLLASMNTPLGKALLPVTWNVEPWRESEIGVGVARVVVTCLPCTSCMVFSPACMACAGCKYANIISCNNELESLLGYTAFDVLELLQANVKGETFTVKNSLWRLYHDDDVAMVNVLEKMLLSRLIPKFNVLVRLVTRTRQVRTFIQTSTVIAPHASSYVMTNVFTPTPLINVAQQHFTALSSSATLNSTCCSTPANSDDLSNCCTVSSMADSFFASASSPPSSFPLSSPESRSPEPLNIGLGGKAAHLLNARATPSNGASPLISGVVHAAKGVATTISHQPTVTPRPAVTSSTTVVPPGSAKRVSSDISPRLRASARPRSPLRQMIFDVTLGGSLAESHIHSSLESLTEFSTDLTSVDQFGGYEVHIDSDPMTHVDDLNLLHDDVFGEPNSTVLLVTSRNTGDTEHVDDVSCVKSVSPLTRSLDHSLESSVGASMPPMFLPSGAASQSAYWNSYSHKNSLI